MNTFTEPAPASDVPPARGRKLGKLVTRARILEVARQQLETLGFDGTSIRGVARAAGVATGTVLLHCADKRDLLHAALFDDLQQSWERARDAQAQRPLASELPRIAQSFFDYYAARPTLSRALLRESLFADPPWSTRFAAQVADVHRHVAALADSAKQRAELAAHVDSNVFAASFLSFYYFALLAWLQGGQPAPGRLFEVMLMQYLAGLGPPPPPARSSNTPRKTRK
ncbi:MAG TPA: TetR/AcrR family transcriptional regulator [Polyangiaceae bacterium]|nr:TetR/AcrR family transcriptional regulator [Polyangiaceae bacterium]